MPSETTRAAVTAHAVPDLGLGGYPELLFQPAIDLTTGQILGFEALVRWVAPGKGTIWPVKLLPWAEARGQMKALNAWVVNEASMQALQWPSSMQVAVNCSTLQLSRSEAASAASEALARSGLAPDRLTIEVTEASLVAERADAELHALARLGVQLTIDGVGGEPSLLRGFPLGACTMKIDGELVRSLEGPEPKGRVVVETIVNLSRSLGICSVAECVENYRQVAALRELRVDVAQGYFFSPPLSADDARTIANASPPLDFHAEILASESRSATLYDAQPLRETPDLRDAKQGEYGPRVTRPSLKAGRSGQLQFRLARAFSDVSDLIDDLNRALEEVEALG
ncbi:MAG TPA: EAL domain-containing protein [Acidimicrobiales bacterium]|nr:EAL domain-containing protein [Acidimicrobiales bacterium]